MTMTASRPHAKGYPGYSELHPRTEAAAPLARSLARTACVRWGLPDEATESAALVIAELFANAVRHASGRSVQVIVDRPSDTRVYLAVIDRAPACLPHLRAPEGDEQSGRGLGIVESLSERWGYDRLGPVARPWGKRCWAELKVAP
ncbi:ATP-binding protein [Streptomyces sp. PAN_FS17]|uniref:ATP-binding protein n=1 Tax=Streptomyces sp. PAN_FS17 TaxID=1855351 RepID=UPI0004C751AE|nr:ATP-binding protein [Streptomyces sp. PAN_FS17]SEB57909.1 Anti-sigma regulatory factor (Ser/Thr protein kinase) [Streptomyces sp. PAN_FS17]